MIDLNLVFFVSICLKLLWILIKSKLLHLNVWLHSSWLLNTHRLLKSHRLLKAYRSLHSHWLHQTYRCLHAHWCCHSHCLIHPRLKLLELPHHIYIVYSWLVCISDIHFDTTSLFSVSRISWVILIYLVLLL